MDLGKDQKEAMKLIHDWFHHGKEQIFRLGGEGGTGKSRMLQVLGKELNLHPSDILFAATTNKAKTRIQDVLVEAGLPAKVVTIQSYARKHNYVHDKNCVVRKYPREVCESLPGCGMRDEEGTQLARSPKLLVCDEASMIDDRLLDDIINVSNGIKILLVGDPKQLPPVVKNNWGATPKNQMEDADYVLSENFRQEDGSKILEVARLVRIGKRIPYGNLGTDVRKITKEQLKPSDIASDAVEITYFCKKTAKVYNGYTKVLNVQDLNVSRRKNLGLTERPVVGDRVIAIRTQMYGRLTAPKGVLGTIKTIRDFDERSYRVEILIDGGTIYNGVISKYNFEEPFDADGNRRAGMEDLDLWYYGYAITGHESQGSEFDNVVVYIQNPQHKYNDYNSWVYTAISRAKQNLLIVE